MSTYDTIGKPALLLASRILRDDANPHATRDADALVRYAAARGGVSRADLDNIVGPDGVKRLRDAGTVNPDAEEQGATLLEDERREPGTAPETIEGIPLEDVRGLLCCALEGGSNYWYTLDARELPYGFQGADVSEGGRLQGASYWHWGELLPTLAGGAVTIGTDEPGDERPARLDLAAVRNGLRLLREKSPRHWADVREDTTDADTGDAFLQYATLGEIVFG